MQDLIPYGPFVGPSRLGRGDGRSDRGVRIKTARNLGVKEYLSRKLAKHREQRSAIRGQAAGHEGTATKAQIDAS
jgi:hypothetical protein